MGQTPDGFFVPAVVQAALNSHRPLDVVKMLKIIMAWGPTSTLSVGNCPLLKEGGLCPAATTPALTTPLTNSSTTILKQGKEKKIHQCPSGATDAVAMQHDVDYATYYTLAWNVINLKVKLGLGH